MKKNKKTIITTIIFVILVALIIVATLIGTHEHKKSIQEAKEKYLYNDEGNVDLDDLEKSFKNQVDSIVGNR